MAKAEKATRADIHGDPLPEQAIARLGTRRLRGTHNILCSTLSPDGKLLVTGSYSGAVRLWDFATGKELCRLATQRESSTYSVAFSPDGKKIAAGGIHREHGIDVWDVATQRQEILRSQLLSEVYALAFSPRGKLLASAGRGAGSHDLLLLWDVEKREVIHRLDGHKSRVNAVAISPDGKLLASGGGWDPGVGDNVVRLWDVSTGKEVAKLDGHKHVVNALAFSPDGKTLATTGKDGHVLLWDIGTKRLRHQLELKRPAFAVAFSKDGRLLAAGGGQHVYLWDPVSGKEIRRMRGWGSNVRSVSFTLDAKTLVTANAVNAVRLWNVATGAEARPLPAHSSPVLAVAFSPDGKYVASLGGDKTVRLWDPDTEKQIHKLETPSGQGSNPDGYGQPLAISPDGKTIAAFVFDKSAPIQFWDAATGNRLFHLPDPAPVVKSLDFSSDGGVLAATSGHGIRLWSLQTRKELRLIGHRAGNRKRDYSEQCALLLPREKIAVAAYSDHVLRFLDVATGKTLARLDLAKQGAKSLAVSPDGRLLAAVGEDGAWHHPTPVRIWEVATGRLLRIIEGHDGAVSHRGAGHGGPVAQIAFSPDGRTLASAGQLDKTVRLWDVVTGKQLAKFEGHDGGVTSVAFSPDGRTLASGSADTTILLWDVRQFVQRAGTAPDGDAFQRLWADLRATSPKTAYKAMDQFAAAGEKAVGLLQKRLQPVQKPDKERVKRLLRDLEAAEFAVREKATADLGELGELVVDELRQALNKNPGPDAKRRLESLLADLRPFVKDPGRLRAVRAIQVLERIGSSKARAVLEQLAGGAAESRLTRDAKAALSRLQSRASKSK